MYFRAVFYPRKLSMLQGESILVNCHGFWNRQNWFSHRQNKPFSIWVVHKRVKIFMAIRVLITIMVRAINEYSWFPWHSANICLSSSWASEQFHDWKVMFRCFRVMADPEDNMQSPGLKSQGFQIKQNTFLKYLGTGLTSGNSVKVTADSSLCLTVLNVRASTYLFWNSVLSSSLLLPCGKLACGRLCAFTAYVPFVLLACGQRGLSWQLGLLVFPSLLNCQLDTA